MVTISRKVVYAMRRDVFDRLLALPVGYFDLHKTGDIISRISYDIDTVNESLSSDLVQMMTTAITVAGSLYMMIMISPRLVLVFAVTVPLSAWITRFLTGKTRPLFRARSASLGRLNGFGEEMITGQKTIKAYCTEEEIIRSFEEKNRDGVEAYYKAEYYGSTVGPMINFINNLSLPLSGKIRIYRKRICRRRIWNTCEKRCFIIGHIFRKLPEITHACILHAIVIISEKDRIHIKLQDFILCIFSFKIESHKYFCNFSRKFLLL